MQLVVLANNNVENSIDDANDNDNPKDWMNFQSEYDIDADGVYGNNNADVGEDFACMTLTRDPFEE